MKKHKDNNTSNAKNLIFCLVKRFYIVHLVISSWLMLLLFQTDVSLVSWPSLWRTNPHVRLVLSNSIELTRKKILSTK